MEDTSLIPVDIDSALDELERLEESRESSFNKSNVERPNASSDNNLLEFSANDDLNASNGTVNADDKAFKLDKLKSDISKLYATLDMNLSKSASQIVSQFGNVGHNVEVDLINSVEEPPTIAPELIEVKQDTVLSNKEDNLVAESCNESEEGIQLGPEPAKVTLDVLDVILSNGEDYEFQDDVPLNTSQGFEVNLDGQVKETCETQAQASLTLNQAIDVVVREELCEVGDSFIESQELNQFETYELNGDLSFQDARSMTELPANEATSLVDENSEYFDADDQNDEDAGFNQVPTVDTTQSFDVDVGEQVGELAVDTVECQIGECESKKNEDEVESSKIDLKLLQDDPIIVNENLTAQEAVPTSTEALLDLVVDINEISNTSIDIDDLLNNLNEPAKAANDADTVTPSTSSPMKSNPELLIDINDEQETALHSSTPTSEVAISSQIIVNTPSSRELDELRAKLNSFTDDQKTLGLIAPVWIPDAEVNECMKCNSKFTFTKRRHHCRGCGLLFCATCCNLRISLQYNTKEQSRVCELCFETVETINELKKRIEEASTRTAADTPIVSVLKKDVSNRKKTSTDHVQAYIRDLSHM